MQTDRQRGVPMSRLRLAVPIVLVAAVGLLVVPISAAGGSTPGQKASACPVKALDKAKGTTEITFWHSTNRANEETLTKLTDQYNSSQSKVHVNLINQTTYKDTLTKYIAGLSTGDLPDIVMIEDTGLQKMIDTQTVLPAASCIKADGYDTSDILPRILSYYSVKKTLYPVPFNVSNPVLYYDKAAFRRAGLDPNKPPTTLDEVMADSQKLKDSGTTQSGF